MIPGLKESLLGLINESAYNPLKKEELAEIFDIHSSEMPMFYNFLNELEEDGYICFTKKGKIVSPNQMGYFVGKFVSHKKGFGFVESDVEYTQDLFISSDNINGAMHNDRVMAEIVVPATEEKRAEGRIVKVIKREITRIVGTFQSSKTFGFVTPDNKKFTKDIYIPKKHFSGAVDNDKVVCEITVWPQEDRKPEGKIIEILGQKGERGVEIDSIIREHGLPEEFPKKVLQEAEAVAVEIPQEEIKRRRDLRDLNIFTIDGDDAKDLDDAISIEVLPNGNFKLGVHIADVTHYVREKNKLDKEALKRATSVYLVDKVIPMLPKTLSNGVCSLNPFEDKLTLSIFMEIDHKGNVVKHEICESVINSKARMTYTEVSDILEKDDEKLKKTFEHVVEDFKNAEILARILMSRREKRGAIDFNFPEAKIILNEKGEVVDIKPYERRISNKIIEEFMLISNETIAEHFYWMGIPFVYRIHETPSLEKMEELSKFISTFGYIIKGDKEEVHPKALQGIIEKIKGKKEEGAISTIMLRSLKQAKYSPECSGHFGLAAKFYCHFTSPIRRYPDLQIHRIIKESLNNKISGKRQEQLTTIVDYASVQSSEKERKAELAERDVHDFYKALYMKDKVGQEFEGVVSSVTSFGIFVELDNTIEGLIRLANMNDDYYIYDESSYSVLGERTKKSYKIGDLVKIKVESVNVDFKEIDFEIVEKIEE
ncbi:TPA: ribonuclease R [Clostridioides difficile]|uniref:ribonuclease R n=1 Tax=Clostridioides difficile TaxID=1496 RepID=UPI00038D498F|nr:ribonuclease R [Clostridioides difficile]EQE75077.1 ribonuclease R [Clostridioides difficile CD47]EQH33519.1 ribonuclease R [Clostridioides difficile DA00238]EQH58804.1 ribonuclease R [Clostridioides difficile DA00273]EQH74451.1 ribonuclease R [Clostridioides difficile DA00307]MBY1166786.1 ribonuclease R [Clostridioides difficile]